MAGPVNHEPAPSSPASVIPATRLGTSLSDLFVLLGHPVSHSLSPAMHRAAFRSIGIPAIYIPLDVTDFDAGWAAVRRLEIRGGNVTVPWKVRPRGHST